MADSDIPVAYATTVPLSTALPRPTLVSQGRSSRVSMPRGKSKVMGQAEILALKEQGFSTGLAQAMTQNNAAFPLRIWVVDNSGSMNMGDGHRMVETRDKNVVKIVDCTRWTELQQTVSYHAQMAGLLQAPTVFRLLNDPGVTNGQQQFSVAERGEQFIAQDIQIAQQAMRSSPTGVTPLAQHIREIRENVVSLEPTLHADGTKVAIILATDGLPTSSTGMADSSSRREFVNALKSLEGLPVWVVIRLCTDEDDVVNYYNELDAQLELSLEVLDDFVGEAQEVYEHNKYLNYALPLHRCREMGYHSRLFDLLDERRLSKDELRELFFLIFGAGQFDGVPDPHADWKGFVQAVSRMAEIEDNQWNPITKKVQPWVDIKKLNKAYGEGGNCSIM